MKLNKTVAYTLSWVLIALADKYTFWREVPSHSSAENICVSTHKQSIIHDNKTAMHRNHLLASVLAIWYEILHTLVVIGHLKKEKYNKTKYIKRDF